MSTYSLEKLNIEKYKEDFDKNIRYGFEQYLYEKNFKISEGIKDKKELKHDLIFSRIFCYDNCEITNYLKKIIIEGADETCDIKKSYWTSVSWDK